MYNVDGLLRAIDTVMASAESRLTESELKLLAAVRSDIAKNNDDRRIEEHVGWLLKSLLFIAEYIEKLT